MNRTRCWWLTRIELAIGVGALVLGLLVVLSTPSPMFGGWSLQAMPLLVAGILGMVIGLVAMIRIVRGPGDRPAAWRYRDR